MKIAEAAAVTLASMSVPRPAGVAGIVGTCNPTKRVARRGGTIGSGSATGPIRPFAFALAAGVTALLLGSLARTACAQGLLETPDRDAVRRSFAWEARHWQEDGRIAQKCGGVDRVEACEDLGGQVRVEDGIGCSNTAKLYQDAGFGRAARVQRLGAGGKVWEIGPGNRVQPLSRDVPPQAVVAKAVASRLVLATDVRRAARRYGSVEAVPLPFGCKCTCVVQTLAEAQVLNAEKGDVGIVPLHSPGGEDVVVALFNAIGQRHRHAVIFVDTRTIRHDTLYDDPDEDDLLDVNEFELGPLNNGTPGIVTESVEDAIRNGRLAYEGLLLKPGAEFIRPAFENAADFALGAQGYYKISDYSGLSGMSLPWSAAGTNAWENQERQGTMCSGFVDWAFDQAGMTITDAFYPASLRNDAADIVFEAVKSEIGSNLGFVQTIGSFLFTGSKKKLANQVTNCFAGLGCDDNSDAWKKGVGSAISVSPDNLLPTQFTLQGSGCAPWGTAEICAGDSVSNPNGAAVTPFLRVEPMQVLGAHWEEQVLEDW